MKWGLLTDTLRPNQHPHTTHDVTAAVARRFLQHHGSKMQPPSPFVQVRCRFRYIHIHTTSSPIHTSTNPSPKIQTYILPYTKQTKQALAHAAAEPAHALNLEPRAAPLLILHSAGVRDGKHPLLTWGDVRARVYVCDLIDFKLHVYGCTIHPNLPYIPTYMYADRSHRRFPWLGGGGGGGGERGY